MAASTGSKPNMKVMGIIWLVLVLFGIYFVYGHFVAKKF